MEIRQLTAEEFGQRMELSMYAFQYRKSTEELEEIKPRFKPDTVWGVFEEGELSAQLTLLPMETYIQGQRYAMGGIASVATWPEKRRQGFVDQLLRHALQLMNESGQSVSFLHPFYFPFYRKYGWELYIDYKTYIIPTALLPAKVQSEGQVKRGIKDIKLLNTVYDAYAAQYNGTLIRTEEWWTYSVLDSEVTQTAIYYDAAGQARGYLLYEVKARKMEIDELVYLDESSRQALWTYIANHDSMINEVTLKAPVDDSLPYLLRDPRIQQQITPYFMARIVNVKQFLEQYPFTPGAVQVVTITVNDSVAGWNEGIWELLINESGQAQVSQRSELPEGVQQDIQQYSSIQTDIQTLTAMLMGYQRPSELYRWERLTGKEEAVAILESRITRTTPYLMDFF
ncbi:GNAT family N-acetyltransferase [Paenibacillus bovis]|uniref:Acetyltransferase n=1 Tax=Paenibacillus bovis TaxID=1616788 RepID=A0A172ZDW9_9BACL|nr:GNAT family N-acetyltransferase [Paenibacillus bovis]ANF95562.1 acetyltransferase [Paenibacillus bovis]